MSSVYQYAKYSSAIWSENNDDWKDDGCKWKAIGSYRNTQVRETSLGNDKLKTLVQHFIAQNFLRSKLIYYVIEYKSKRVDICYDYMEYPINTFIIVEADRGEDCGKIIGFKHEEKYNMIVHKLKDVCCEVDPKKIIRLASSSDIDELTQRKKDEESSLEKCRHLVMQKNINMDILGCEYQWDMKKITFYFKSCKRIDFRDLLKELFKTFKIRIWLCAERKTLNLILKSMLELK